MASKPVILVIDDEKATRSLTQDALSDLGTIVMLSSGEEAYHYLEQAQRADLLIIDIVMEGMNGIELLKKVRQLHEHNFLPCLIYTAYSDQTMERLAFDAGATDFIEKPISFTRLQMRVKAHLQSKQLYEQLREAATVDHLTKVLNRQAFLHEAYKEIKRAARMPYLLGVLILDLDNFKTINDSFGHAVGDKSLALLAETLAASYSREGELVGRYAGDEFMAISFGLEADTIIASAQAMVRSVHAIELYEEGQRVDIACSVGLLILDCSRCQKISSSEHELLPALLAKADKQLYQVKQQGGDSVCHDFHCLTGMEVL
ncbi:MAG: diguanylate cyclase [Oceanospirillales bacterium]|nr:diguanylate cyclase [Oceanospirillales bacterium]MBR9886764.1 diguanylate cyclase [Oceanospirillales bacterium]